MERRIVILSITFLLVGLFLSSLGLWLMIGPKQFMATAKLNLVPQERVSDFVLIEPEYFQIVSEKIQSSNTLANVAELLNLNAEWGKQYGDGTSLKTTEAIDLLRLHMSLDFARNTPVVKINFFSENPDQAATIANAIANSYQEFRLMNWRQSLTHEIEALTEEFHKGEQNIKIKRENLEQLRNQSNVPSPEPADELLNSNYSSYFQAKQQFQRLTDIHKALSARIEMDKFDLQSATTSTPMVVEVAKAPKFPTKPNRWLGVAFLMIGLFPSIAGFLLLKSARRIG